MIGGNSPAIAWTEIRVTILGGRHDAWEGRIRIPLAEEAAGYVRLQGIVYRVRREGGRTFLVHPTAQKLFWP